MFRARCYINYLRFPHDFLLFFIIIIIIRFTPHRCIINYLNLLHISGTADHLHAMLDKRLCDCSSDSHWSSSDKSTLPFQRSMLQFTKLLQKSAASDLHCNPLCKRTLPDKLANSNALPILLASCCIRALDFLFQISQSHKIQPPRIICKSFNFVYHETQKKYNIKIQQV